MWGVGRGEDGFEELAECLIQNCSHLETQGEFRKGTGLGWGTISVEVEDGMQGVSGLSEGQQEEH